MLWHCGTGSAGAGSASPPRLGRAAGSELPLPIRQGHVSTSCGHSSSFSWQSKAASYSHPLTLLHCSHPTSLSEDAGVAVVEKSRFLFNGTLLAFRGASPVGVRSLHPQPSLPWGRRLLQKFFLF